MGAGSVRGSPFLPGLFAGGRCGKLRTPAAAALCTALIQMYNDRWKHRETAGDAPGFATLFKNRLSVVTVLSSASVTAAEAQNRARVLQFSLSCFLMHKACRLPLGRCA